MILVVVACVVIAILAVAVWPGERDREPSYQGKKLSEWLDLQRKRHHGDLTVEEIDATPEAIRRIGTNALPSLVKWIGYDEKPRPKWVEAVLDSLPRVIAEAITDSLPTPSAAVRADLASVGFEIIGPEARPAIPQLVLIASRGGTYSSTQAIRALGCIGPEGIAALGKELTSTHQTNRLGILTALQNEYLVGTNGFAAVPSLLLCLNDTDSHVVEESLVTLGTLRAEPDITVPALMKLLRHQSPWYRRQAADFLSGFGDLARSSVTTLLEAREDSEFEVRFSATNALKTIAPELFETNAISGSDGK